MPTPINQQLLSEPEEVYRAIIDGLKKDLWVAMPARLVEDADMDKQTCKLEMTIKGRVVGTDGKAKNVDYPQLYDVPIKFARGGGFVMTHPVKKGDQGTVFFMSRAMDGWFQNGGVQNAQDLRSHSLSDGKFFPGVHASTEKLKHVSASTVQMRSVDEGDDSKPKHVFDFDQTNGTFTHSVDSGRHVTTMDKDAGVSTSVEYGKHSVKISKDDGVQMSAFDSALQIFMASGGKITSKGTWMHDGGIRATETVQSDVGLKGPLIGGSPGNPPDVS